MHGVGSATCQNLFVLQPPCLLSQTRRREAQLPKPAQLADTGTKTAGADNISIVRICVTDCIVLFRDSTWRTALRRRAQKNGVL
jgi:hypothetical protein